MMTLVPAQSMKSRQKVRFVTFVERSGGRFILDEGSGRLLKKKKKDNHPLVIERR